MINSFSLTFMAVLSSINIQVVVRVASEMTIVLVWLGQ